MLVPLTPTAWVDTCQVARLRAQGAQTVVTTYTGPEFVVGLALAAVAALVNGTPAGTLLALFNTTQGPQWLGGQNVTTLTQLASGVRARIGQATAIVTGMTAADLATALNALATCGGGAPPPPPTFLESGSFVPIITNPTGNTFAVNGPCTLTRAGGLTGNIILGTVRLFGTVAAGDSLSIVVGGLPTIPNAGFQCVASARMTAGDPYPTNGLLINRENANAFYVQGGPFVLETTMNLDLTFGYVL